MAQRPEGLKLLLYTGSGATRLSTPTLPWTARPLSQFAMEILQHVYRLGEAAVLTRPGVSTVMSHLKAPLGR